MPLRAAKLSLGDADLSSMLAFLWVWEKAGRKKGRKGERVRKGEWRTRKASAEYICIQTPPKIGTHHVWTEPDETEVTYPELETFMSSRK